MGLVSYRGGFSGGRNSVSLQFHPPPLDFMAKIPKTWKKKSFLYGEPKKSCPSKNVFFLVCVAALLDVRGVAVELILPNNDTDRFPSFSQIEV